MINAIQTHTSVPTPSRRSDDIKTFLMCEPLFFDVAYVINPWMQGNINKVNQQRAHAQWTALYEEIKQHANVELIEPVEGLPDMVFTANAGAFVDSGMLWLSAFLSPFRQGEEQHFFDWFLQHGYKVIRDYTDVNRQTTPYAFEGAGDCLRDRMGVYWLGYGSRTSLGATTRMSTYFDHHEWNKVLLVDPRFYHLDTCFCPLSSGHILWYPAAFSPQSQEIIRAKRDQWLIEVPEKDAAKFACNAVEPTPGTLILPFVSKGLQKTLTSIGYTVTQLELTEFIKSGGAAKCLTLEV